MNKQFYDTFGGKVWEKPKEKPNNTWKMSQSTLAAIPLIIQDI